MAGVDLDSVAELNQTSERVEEALRPLARVDSEIRTCGIADEQRVSRQDEPRLGRT